MAYVNANYVIVEAGDPNDLREKVMVYLQDNFRLQGGIVVVALGNDNYLYAQGMTFNVDTE